jgi:hypothetical protein
MTAIEANIMNRLKLMLFIPVTFLVACTIPSLPNDSSSVDELSSLSTSTILASSSDSSSLSSSQSQSSSTSEVTPTEYDGYTSIQNWPTQVISSYLADFEIIDTVPNHAFVGPYWYATGEDDYGPYLEVFNLQPNAGVVAFATLLQAQNWAIEDYSEGGISAYVAVHPNESIYIEVFYYGGDDFYPAGITWYISPLATIESPIQEPDASKITLTFAGYTGTRTAITNGFQWTTSEGFIFKQLKGTSTSAPRTEIENLRVYQNHILEFILPTGFIFVQIRLNLQVDYSHGPIIVNGTLTNGTLQALENVYVITPNSNTRTLTLTAGIGSQVRLLNIEVYYNPA